MDETMHFQTWQDFLKSIIENPSEKQRIAQEIRVNPVTLNRWSNGERQPRTENLIALLRAIPLEYYEEFRSLVERADPTIAQQLQVEVPMANTLPSEFYMRALHAYTSIPPSLYPQTLYDLILQQAIEQLDPARRGMSISVVVCVPPLRGTYVRSLREFVGVGNPPWKRDLDHSSAFLGIESLSGSAVTRQRMAYIQSRDEPFSLSSAQWVSYEESAAAYPITRQTKVAGCLLVSSAQPNYFTPALLALIEQYANLMSLAFEPDQFFDHKDIHLQVLPKYEDQIPLLQTFQSRVSRKFAEATERHEFMTLDEAQRAVWQELEEELLQLSSSSSE
jgi:hypothetical protein